MLTLPEITKRLAARAGIEPSAMQHAIRGYRDKGAISPVGFRGRAALYDDAALAKIAVLLALQDHGFEGSSLGSILALLNKHNAQLVPYISSPSGFARVVQGIKDGEQWTLRFSTDRRKIYWGSCQIAGGDTGLIEDRTMTESLGCYVVTTVDLSTIIAPLLQGEN